LKSRIGEWEKRGRSKSVIRYLLFVEKGRGDGVEFRVPGSKFCKGLGSPIPFTDFCVYV
jgi:hypothetical protein